MKRRISHTPATYRTETPKVTARIITQIKAAETILRTRKSARDNKNVYFLVKCADNITPYDGKNRMNLYIDTDEKVYDFNEDDKVDNKDVVALFRHVSAEQ